MLFKVHIKSPFFANAKNVLNYIAGKPGNTVCMSSQQLFFISLTHHTCSDPKNAGKDETAWPKETEKQCDDSGWKKN